MPKIYVMPRTDIAAGITVTLPCVIFLDSNDTTVILTEDKKLPSEYSEFYAETIDDHEVIEYQVEYKDKGDNEWITQDGAYPNTELHLAIREVELLKKHLPKQQFRVVARVEVYGSR